jgi:hypothetical protein
MPTTVENPAIVYNSLPDVRDSDQHLSTLGREDALSELLTIIAKHGAESWLGIRLLHKHNCIGESESMIESYAVDSDGLSLITKATSTGDGPMDENVVANSWRFFGGRYLPVEFSARELVENPDEPVDLQSPVFREIASALTRRNAADTLGPALRYSALVEAHRPAASAKLIETTDEDQRANVLRFVDASAALAMPTIETKWTAERRFTDGESVVVVASECACFVFPEGGHSGTHTSVGGGQPDDDDDDDDDDDA